MSSLPLPPYRHDDARHGARHGAAGPTDDELTARITRALRSHEDDGPGADVVAARLATRLADARTVPSRAAVVTRRVAVAGVVTSSLAVAGTGAAAAWDPYSGVSRTASTVAQAVGLDWSPLPGDYTFEQHDAFWGAGYTTGDMEALSDLWNMDSIETKAKAGQMVLDGQPVPVPAGTHRDRAAFGGGTSATQLDAYFGAGYGFDDAEALAALWQVEFSEAKAMAGQMLLDGRALPVAPSGEPVRDTVPPDLPAVQPPPAGTGE